MKQRKSRGFTLIELMIVVVVLSIITTIAVSSYRGSVLKARRAEAKADLLELTQLIERFRTENNTFVGFTRPFTTSPRNGQAFYNLQFPAGQPTATTYILQAVPQGAQANDTRCLTLTINQAGVRGTSGSGTVADCW